MRKVFLFINKYIYISVFDTNMFLFCSSLTCNRRWSLFCSEKKNQPSHLTSSGNGRCMNLWFSEKLKSLSAENKHLFPFFCTFLWYIFSYHRIGASTAKLKCLQGKATKAPAVCAPYLLIYIVMLMQLFIDKRCKDSSFQNLHCSYMFAVLQSWKRGNTGKVATVVVFFLFLFF